MAHLHKPSEESEENIKASIINPDQEKVPKCVRQSIKQKSSIVKIPKIQMSRITFKPKVQAKVSEA